MRSRAACSLRSERRRRPEGRPLHKPVATKPGARARSDFRVRRRVVGRHHRVALAAPPRLIFGGRFLLTRTRIVADWRLVRDVIRLVVAEASAAARYARRQMGIAPCQRFDSDSESDRDRPRSGRSCCSLISRSIPRLVMPELRSRWPFSRFCSPWLPSPRSSPRTFSRDPSALSRFGFCPWLQFCWPPCPGLLPCVRSPCFWPWTLPLVRAAGRPGLDSLSDPLWDLRVDTWQGDAACCRVARVIAFEHVHFAARRARVVLHDVTFDGGSAAKRSRSSGAAAPGKSTVLKLINRMLEPAGGRVLVDGRDTRAWDSTTLRRQTGYVLQEVGLFPHMTVARNVGLVPTLAQWPRGADRGADARAARPGGSAARRVRRTLARRALGRPASARRRGARAGRRSAGRADGRAVRCARSDHARGVAPRVPPHSAAACARPS